jgi:signal transduction histidine kinase
MEMNKAESIRKRVQPLLDLYLIVALALGAFALANAFHLLDRFVAWYEAQHESAAVEELIVVAVILAFAFAVFAMRRWKELEREIVQRQRAEAQHERGVQQLVALSHMGQTVLSSLDLPTVLNRVIAEVVALLPSQEISILLRDREELVFAAVSGPAAEALRGRQMPAQAGIAGEVLQSERMVYVRDAAADTRMYLEPSKLSGYRPRSVLAVPLKWGVQVLGVLEAVHPQADAFSGDDVYVFEGVAHWAAIAIANARQLEELKRRLHETQTLADINRALNQTLDLGQILDSIVDAAQRLIPRAEESVIHLLQEKEQLLQPVAKAGGSGEGAHSLQMHTGEGIAGQVLAQGHAINVDDVQKDARYLSPGAPPGLHSLLVAPIRGGERRLGTISVQSSAVNAFSTDDERLLMQLGIQAAIAIENARLFEETNKRANQLGLLYDAGLALNSMLEPRVQLRYLFQIAMRTLHANHAAFFRYDATAKEALLDVGIGQGEPAFAAAAPSDLPTADDRRLLSWVIEHRVPLTIGDLRADSHWNATVDLKLPSRLVVPVEREQRLLGILMVSSAHVNAFTPDHERLLLLFANQAAVAMENARLYTELQDALRHEKAIRAQLVLADKLAALGRMVASVAHELNNPLQSIQNCLYIIGQGNSLSSSKQEFLKIAQAEIERLSSMITQLRSVYVSSSKNQVQLQAVGEILHDVQALMATHFRKNKVRCQIEPPAPGLDTAHVPEQFRQVFINLCLNAVDAMQPAGGVLTLQVLRSKRQAELGVAFQDTGRGIPADDLAHVFEPFFTTKETGMGLGLAICYDIVHGYGGRITVESEPGEGATFTVWLPLNSVPKTE